MKKSILLLFAALLPLVASAQTKVEIDGIWYNLISKGKVAEVTYKGDSYDSYDEYSGSITIPATVTHEGVDYSVTSIGSSAFRDCNSLTAITLPEGVTSIGDYAFSRCSSLTAITIPENSKLTSIGDYAFSRCSSLTAITIPESVTSIGDDAFYYCSSLIFINLPESIISTGDRAFYKTAWYDSLPDGVIYVGCCLYAYKGTMPNDTNIEVKNGTVSICIKAFYNCTGLTSITIPEGVTTIGSGAFSGCTGLTSITIPEGVTTIGSGAFSGCSSLSTITIPESVINAGGTEGQGNIFSGTSWYENLPNGVVYVGKVLYCYKSSGAEASSIDIKEGTICINPSAFSYSSNLTSITIPESVTSIGDEAFSSCSSLTSINIPEKVTSIGRGAFAGCKKLTVITLPPKIECIENHTFFNCSSLTSINIPNKVKRIGTECFWGCQNLKEVNITDVGAWCDIDFTIDTGSSTDYSSNPLRYARVLKCNGEVLSNIVIPNTVENIKPYAFYCCECIESIQINDQINGLDYSTFLGCSSLKELTLGKGLKKIGAGAFSTCTALEKITIYATQPPRIDGVGNALFAEVTYENATLYVPQGSASKYQVMTGWSGFYNISEIEGSTPDYLTLRQADNGEIRIAVDLGRTYQMQVVPSTGWKIHTVTFDGKDMTAQLADDNTFTTPTINGSAVLNVAYVKEGSAIAAATASRIKVQGHQGIISIAGATEGEAIGLYTTDGTLVTREIAEGDTTHLTVPTGQVYIVKVADTVVKIGM